MSERFTKPEIQNAIEAVDEMFKALPKTKQMSYLGHLNDILLALEAAKRVAPEK